MILRELVALFGLEVDQRSFRKADTAMNSLKKGAKALAGIFVANRAVQGFRRIIEETARAGDSIDKVSEKLGVSAQALQELRFAADLTGVPLRTMDMALQRFTRRAAEAAQGTGEAKAILEELGIQLKDSQGQLRPTEELLGDVAEKMQGMTSDGDRLRAAFKLFDSEGAALVNTLAGGREALEGMRSEARSLGGVMDQELIDSSVEFTDNSKRLGEVLQGIKNLIAKELLPIFNDSIVATLEWVRANRDLIATRIERWLRIAVTVVGLMADTLGTVVGLIVDMVDLLPEWSKQIAVILGIGLALAAVFGAPVVLVLALLGLLALLIQDLQSADSFFNTLVDGFLEEADRLGTLDAIRNIFKTAIKFWKEDIAEFWRWFRRLVLPDVFNDLVDKEEADERAFKKVLEGPDINEIISAAGGVEALIAASTVVSAEKVAGVAAGGTTTVGPQSVFIEQTIQTQPGMDAEAVGNAAAKSVEEALSRSAGHTQRALVPSGVPQSLLDLPFE